MPNSDVIFSLLDICFVFAGGGSTSSSKAASAASAQPNRDVEGRLYAGHDSFDWLLAVITAVMAAEVNMCGGRWWAAAIATENAATQRHDTRIAEAGLDHTRTHSSISALFLGSAT